MATEMTINTSFENAEMQRVRIRNVLSMLTDLQKLRISTGNRLVASHKELAAMSHIREEEDADGNVILENEAQSTVAMKNTTAAIMNKLLQEVARVGTATVAVIAAALRGAGRI